MRKDIDEYIIEIEEYEAVINTLKEINPRETNVFENYIYDKVMTINEMKNACSLLRKKVNELGMYEYTDSGYSQINSDIILVLTNLKISINYYIKEGKNLHRVFEESFEEINKKLQEIDINDEEIFTIIKNRYEKLSSYASQADISVSEKETQIQRKLARNNLKKSTKENNKRRRNSVTRGI